MMSFSAIEAMQEKNLKAFGIPFPCRPESPASRKNISCIERECLDFLISSCEELRFDPAKKNLEDRDGRSISPNQIPYNMEKDLDRLCLVNAIDRFMKSGVAKDAFDVYFCYLEMFIGNYGQSKKMIEMLAEFETNASSLLMSHRDHYSHSVYVFILGLAIFRRNQAFRDAFRAFYGLNSERESAHAFLRYWGLTALFHDIGYPFELPFMQVKSYFSDEDAEVPFVRYGGIDPYVSLSQEDQAQLGCRDILDLLAGSMSHRLYTVYGDGKSESEYAGDLYQALAKRATDPGEFMDHAYFSAILLTKKLLATVGAQAFDTGTTDSLTAILLHNSFYKYTVTCVKDPARNRPFAMELHPLAYMLMLCDELQCWDRTSYGQASRRELHAMWCDLSFDGDNILAHYYFDREQEYKKDHAKGTYQKMVTPAGETGTVKFLQDIEDIVAINRPGTPGLRLEVSFASNNRETRTYASRSSFLHLYQFAVALNARYWALPTSLADDADGAAAQAAMEEAFDQLSLEYKLSNIMQAKAFAGYLDRIGCFFTDKPVAYELLDHFSPANMDVIGPLEHDRWVREKRSMGWSLDGRYQDRALLLSRGVAEEDLKKVSKQLRELTRTHVLMIDDYHELDQAEQDKDTEPMNRMLDLIKEYDGLRIYRL